MLMMLHLRSGDQAEPPDCKYEVVVRLVLRHTMHEGVCHFHFKTLLFIKNVTQYKQIIESTFVATTDSSTKYFRQKPNMHYVSKVCFTQILNNTICQGTFTKQQVLENISNCFINEICWTTTKQVLCFKIVFHTSFKQHDLPKNIYQTKVIGTNYQSIGWENVTVSIKEMVFHIYHISNN